LRVKTPRRAIRYSHRGHHDGEQELEDPPDVVVRVVGALEDEWVDACPLPKAAKQ